MNDFFYKKRIAVPIFIVMVLFSIFVLGGSDLRKEANKALDVFYGDYEYDIDVSLECENIIANGKNLLVIANKYLEKDDVEVAVLNNRLNDQPISGDRLERAIRLVSGMRMLQGCIDEVMIKLSVMDITDRDREYLIKIETDIDASVRKAKLNNYNEFYEKYMEMVSNPYTGLIAKFNGIKYLPLVSFR